MRRTFIQPFDQIQQKDRKTKPLRIPLLKQKIVEFQKQEQKKRKKVSHGLKDLSCFYEDQTQKQKTRFFEHLPVFNPENGLSIIWLLLVEMAIIYNFYMIPLVIFFGQNAFKYDADFQIKQGLIINIVVLFILVIDIFVKLNLGYYQDEHLIMSRPAVFRRYISKLFAFDAIGTVSLFIYIVGNNYALIYLRLVFYIKIVSLVDMDRAIKICFQTYKPLMIFYSLFRIIVILWFFATWSAGMFFAIDYSYYDATTQYYQKGALWLTNSQQVDYIDIIAYFPQWYIWYEYALYWAIQTSSTTGYGTITPKNPNQIVYCNFIMLFMTVFFAYFINSVWDIIKYIQEGDQYNDKWFQLKIYLNSLPLPYQERRKISDYMIQLFKDQEQQQIETFISQNVSKQLQDEYNLALKSNIFAANPFLMFINKIPSNQSLMIKLVNIAQQYRVGDQQIVYKYGEFDPYLYYNKSGHINLSLKIGQISYSSYDNLVESNQFFGAEQFFYRVPRFHQATASSFARMWRISYQNLHKCLKQQQIVNELWCLLKYQITIQNKMPALTYSKTCWGCNSSGHFINKCPKYCYQIQQQIQINSIAHEQKQEQPRQQMKRRKQKDRLISKIIHMKNENRQHNVDRCQILSYYQPQFNLTSGRWSNNNNNNKQSFASSYNYSYNNNRSIKNQNQ